MLQSRFCIIANISISPTADTFHLSTPHFSEKIIYSKSKINQYHYGFVKSCTLFQK